METSTDKRILRLERALVLLLDYLTDRTGDFDELKDLVGEVKRDVEVRS